MFVERGVNVVVHGYGGGEELMTGLDDGMW